MTQHVTTQRPSPRRLLRARLAGLTAAALALALAACGSQLDPETVADVNGTTVNNQVGTSGTGTEPGTGTDPGTGDTGTGDTGSTGTGSDAGSGDDTGSSGDSGSGDPAANAPKKGANSAAGDGPQVSCKGFANQTGITDKEIVIANSSDISGPVPGIFESAQDSTRAYAAYFNSQNDICGRKLKVLTLDSRTDSGADQQAYAKACEQAFAAVGSMSAFDAGGAGVAEDCGLPDLRSTIVNPERQKCSTCFATQPVATNLVPDAMASWFAKHHKEASQHVAVLYIDAGASPVNAESLSKGWEKGGWNVDYFQGIDVAEFNFAPYVQQMKNKGIKFVTYVGPYQNTIKLQQAMKQQSFEPDVYLQDATIYDSRYVKEAGDYGENSYVYLSNELFANTSNKEMALYLSWLNQVKPGASPNMYGLYAWSATRLFVEKALALGGSLDRKSLVNALNKVDGWTGNGLHAPMHIASGKTSECQNVIQLKDGTWRKVSPGRWMCGRLNDTGIGG